MSEAYDSQTDSMIFYAFRYCLGRQTYAVQDCADYLRRNWPRLNEFTRALIKKEINDAFMRNRYGSEIDRKQWQGILELEP